MPTATILVVEDDPLQMDMLEMILTRNDFDVILRASTGEMALELFHASTPRSISFCWM